MEELIAKDLTLGYDNSILIKDLSFTLEEGDYLCIVGENGAGKSTLMRTLLGLQKPISGTVEMPGINVSEVGYLPQQTKVQRDFPASVKEVILSGCQSRLKGRLFYTKEDKKLAMDNMVRLGIDDLANNCYRDLSGGQQQRVLLARALCATKKMLLLDEPVAGLDPKVTLEMYDIIKQLNNEGISIIMISHDILSSVRYAKHILHIGSTIYYGTTEEYLASNLGEIYVKGSEAHE